MNKIRKLHRITPTSAFIEPRLSTINVGSYAVVLSVSDDALSPPLATAWQSSGYSPGLGAPVRCHAAGPDLARASPLLALPLDPCFAPRSYPVAVPCVFPARAIGLPINATWDCPTGRGYHRQWPLPSRRAAPTSK